MNCSMDKAFFAFFFCFPGRVERVRAFELRNTGISEFGSEFFGISHQLQVGSEVIASIAST